MKKLRLVFLLYFLLLPVIVNAHAVLEQDSLQIPPLAVQKSAEIKLRFNSSVEANLARFFLISEGDQQHLLVSHAGQTAGEVRVLIPPLPMGKYALKFKIFATDSHLTEDVIYFFVK